MNILLASSTAEEIQGTIDYLEKEWDKKSFWTYEKGEHTITTLVSGIGMMYTVYALCCQPEMNEIDLILNPGIGAALSRTIDLGRVYVVEHEGFGDIGLEESDGTFHDLHDLGWHKRSKRPFERGVIRPKKFLNPTYLPRATAITVNKIPGNFDAIEHFDRKFHADLVSLDGAGVFFVGSMFDKNVLSLKVATRYVEPWLKEVPHFEGSVAQLNMRTIDVIKNLIAPEQEESNSRLFR